MAEMNAEVVLSLIDKLSGPMKKLQRQFAGFTKQLDSLNKPARNGGIGKQFADAEVRARKLRMEVGRLKGVMGNLKTHAGKLFGRAGIAGMLFGAIPAGTAAAFLRPAAEFEELRSRLKTSFGGNMGEAEQAFSWVKQFATKTPFQVGEATDAFIKLVDNGIDPTSGAMQVLGDAAAARGKGMVDTVEAVGDAMMGENERLKEAFGITGTIKGDSVFYTFMGIGGKQQTVKANLRDRNSILKTLLGILGKYKGAAEDQSKGWKGLVSNLQDVRDQFLDMVANSGPFQRMKDMLRSLLEEVDRADKDGRLKRWAENIGKFVTDGIDKLVPIAQGAWNFAKDAATVIERIAKAVGGYKELGYFVGALWLAGPALNIINTASKAAAIMTTIGAVATGGAAVGLAGMAVGLAGIATALGAVWLAWDDTIFTKLQNFRPGESKGKAFGTINEDDWTLVKNLKALATLDAEWSRVIEEELNQALARLGTALYSFGAKMVQSIVDGIVGAAYKIGAALNSIVPETTPNPGTYMGPRRGFVQPAPSDPVQPRAMGGSIYSGGTYLTGERGPELITAGRGGHVTANSDLAKRFGNAGNTVNINISGNTVNGGSTENALSKLADMISKRVSTGLHDGAYV